MDADDQPLFIDQQEFVIKCRWCKKLFHGSRQLRHVNQHVRKSISHQKHCSRFHKQGGAQHSLHDFLNH